MRTLLPLLCCLLLAKTMHSQPDTVKIGAFINDIYDINLSEKSFSTQFWVWFNYRDSSLHPLETVEFPNAKSIDATLGFTEEKNGIYWAGKKIHAILKRDWDVALFPFDEQHLTVEMEESDSDISDMVYVADVANTKLDTALKIPNWMITNFQLRTSAKKYDTTYGDPSLSGESAYPHAELTLTIKRRSWGLFFSLFTGLYVAFFISTLVFFIDPIDLDPRFGLSVGALFASVGNKYIVDSFLPQSTTFTLVDKLHILTYIFLLLCIVLSVISLRIWKNGRETASRKFDRRAYAWITGLYLGINFWLIYSSSCA